MLVTSAARCALTVFISCAALGLPRADAQHERHRGVPIATAEYQRVNGLALNVVEPSDGTRVRRDVDLDNLRLRLQVPLPLGSTNTILIPMARYESLWIAVDSDTEARPVTHLAIGEVRLSLRQVLSKRWALVPSLSLGFASNLDGFGDRDLFGGGSLLASYAFTDSQLVLGAGVAVAVAADGVLPLPAVLVRWAPQPSFWINIALPATLEVGYAPWQNVELALRARFNGARYALRGIPGVEAVRNAVLTAGPSAAVHVGGGIHIRASAGLASLVQVDLQRVDGGAIIENAGVLGWFARAILEYRVFP